MQIELKTDTGLERTFVFDKGSEPIALYLLGSLINLTGLTITAPTDGALKEK